MNKINRQKRLRILKTVTAWQISAVLVLLYILPSLAGGQGAEKYHLVTFVSDNPYCTFSAPEKVLATPADYEATPADATASDATESDAVQETASSADASTGASSGSDGSGIPRDETGALADGPVPGGATESDATAADTVISGLRQVTVFVKDGESLTAEQIPKVYTSSKWIGTNGWTDGNGYYYATKGLLASGIVMDTTLHLNTFSTRLMRLFAADTVCAIGSTEYKTLPEAVANANIATADTVIRMTVPSYDLGSTSLNVGNSSGKTITLTTDAAVGSSCTIRRTYNGGTMVSLTNGGLTLENLVLDGNSAGYTGSSAGGAVRVSGSSTLTLNSGAVIRDSKSTAFGGGVYLSGGCSMYMHDGAVAENCETTALYGGFLFQEGSSLFVADGGTVRNNFASAAGSSGGGIMQSSDGTNIVTELGGSFSASGNRARANGTFIHGGGSGSVIRLTGNASVRNNIRQEAAGYQGGAVFVYRGFLQVKDAPTVSGNVQGSGTVNNICVFTGRSGGVANAITVSGTLTGGKLGVYGEAYAEGNQFAVTGSTAYGGLNVFSNDRNAALVGAAGTGTAVVWAGPPVCKIVDASGNVRTYSSLAAAVTAANAAATDAGATIQMLTDFTENAGWTVTNTQANVRITTAKTTAAGCTDGYPYTGSSADGRAVITLGQNFQYKMNAAGKTLTLDRIALAGSSRTGAAVEIDAGEADVKDTKISDFKNTSAASPGGVFYVKGGKLVLGSGGSGDTTTVTGCTAASSGPLNALSGGAIAFIGDGTAAEVRGGTYTGNGQNAADPWRGGCFAIGTSNAASTFAISGGTFSGNFGSHGSVIDSYGNGPTVSITGGTFTGNSCYYDGGVVFWETPGTLNLSGGTFTGNSCGRCGSVFSLRGGTMNISGSPVMRNNNGNTSNSTEGTRGVISSITALEPTIYLSGSPVIQGNTYRGSETADLSVSDAAKIIVGTLNGDAGSIGICSKSSGSTISTAFTAVNAQFATAQPNAAENGVIRQFFNDSNASLSAWTTRNASPILWGTAPVAKIVHYNAGHTVQSVSVYRTLEAAVIDANAAASDEDATIQMLVPQYDIAAPSISVSNAAGKNVTITTAAADAADGYPYRGSAGTNAVLRRGTANTDSLFTVPSGKSLSLDHVTLDGGSLTGAGSAKYLIACNGTLNLNAQAVLQNNTSTLATNTAGAVYSVNGFVNVNDGARITNCRAQYGGGISGWGATIRMSDGSIDHCVSVRNTADSGSAVHIWGSGRFEMSGGSITDNAAIGTTAAGGGAVGVEGGTCILSGGSIRNNTGKGTGGGVFSYAGTTVQISGSIEIKNNYGSCTYDAAGTLQTQGSASNLYRNSGSFFQVTGDLTGSVGVTSPTHMAEGLQFAVSSAASASTVQGLENFFADTNTDGNPDNLYGAAGTGNQVIWRYQAAVLTVTKHFVWSAYTDLTKKATVLCRYTDQSGVVRDETRQLGNGESFVVRGIRRNTQVTVTEADCDGYTPAFSFTSAPAGQTLVRNGSDYSWIYTAQIGATELSITNTKKEIVPTGISGTEHNGPWGLIVLLLLSAILFFRHRSFSKRRTSSL